MTSKNPTSTTPCGDVKALPSRAQPTAQIDGADEAPPRLTAAKAKGKVSTLLIVRHYKPDLERQVDALLRLLQSPGCVAATLDGRNQPPNDAINSSTDDWPSQSMSSVDGGESEHERPRIPQ